MQGIRCFIGKEEAESILLNQISSSGAAPLLVCISGPSCSGKTTLGEELALVYTQKVGQSAAVLRMDDWFRDIDDCKLPRAENGASSFDWPQSYRYSDLRKAVAALAAGREIIYPSYDLAGNRRQPSFDRIMRSSKLIIIEGLYSILFCRDLLPKTFNIWAYAPFFTRLQRRLIRDRTYGMDEPEIISRFLHAQSCFERFGYSQREWLDIVVCSAW